MKTTSPIPSPSITVTGRGQVLVPPDRIVFTIVIASLAPTVEESVRLLDGERVAVQAALAAASVPGHRIRSGGPDFRPRHEYEKEALVFKGIAGSENVTVRIPFAPNRTTEVLRQLGEQVRQVRIDVSYVASQPDPARDKALAAAVADARAQAQAILATAGGRLGMPRVIAVPSFGAGGAHRSLSSPTGQPASGNEVAPQAVSIQRTIEITWEILAPGVS